VVQQGGADFGSSFTYLSQLPATALVSAHPTIIAASHGSIIRADYDAETNNVVAAIGGATLFTSTAAVQTVVAYYTADPGSRSFGAPVLSTPVAVRLLVCLSVVWL
jgi:hypothetical protein